jgi:hypothetical protein
MMILGQGNHESAILKRQETDVLERFAGAMGGNVPVMGYHFWVIFKVFSHDGVQRGVVRYYAHHGSGGGGAVTRGQINQSRYMMHVEGADIISMGHIHEKNIGEVMVHYFDNNCNSFMPKCRGVITAISSTYKQEYIDHGFHNERGRPPKPLGGTYLTCHLERKANETNIIKEARFFGTRTFAI